MEAPSYQYLALDVGGVLFSYSAAHVTAPSPRQLKNALDSPLWYQYERGEISQDECDERIAAEFGFDITSWRDALDEMRDSLQPNKEFITAIRQLKKLYPHLKFYGMTNMPKEDFEQLKATMEMWRILDDIYPSARLGHRKPDVACYEKFAEESQLQPESCIFVDDRLENVVAAQSLGFHGLLFEQTQSAVTTLHNLLGDPVARGNLFLNRNRKNLFSETTMGSLQPDNYSQLLILQCTGNKDLVTLERTGVLWNYFIGEPEFAGTKYPVDSDTTALAMVVCENVPDDEKEYAMRMMLLNVNSDGLPLCWFDPSRPRFCHCISANVFRFFCLNSRGHELSSTYVYLCRLLRTQAYLLGTRYYESPDWMLYILADLCSKRRGDEFLQEMQSLVEYEVTERMGCDRDLLSAALRLLAAQSLGFANPKDLKTVLAAQQVDGGWERVWLWRYGKEKVKIGGRGVITAMAVRGVQTARNARACS